VSSSPSAAGVSDPSVPASHGLLLFDGVCNLCNGFVNFVLDHDPAGYFHFGALQSEAARPYLEAHGVPPDSLDSVVLIEDNRVYTRSSAALRVLRRLDGGWPLLYLFILIPRPLRDWVYDRIADVRYDWFGTRDRCRMPTPERQARFIEQSA
jgi:predicted DCC family thiol-disulfide oxidoreductase YuxK